jgi:hypothetical protein
LLGSVKVLIQTSTTNIGCDKTVIATTGPAGPLAYALLTRVIPIASRIPPKNPRI